jgi:hypothetical protein
MMRRLPRILFDALVVDLRPMGYGKVRKPLGA